MTAHCIIQQVLATKKDSSHTHSNQACAHRVAQQVGSYASFGDAGFPSTRESFLLGGDRTSVAMVDASGFGLINTSARRALNVEVEAGSEGIGRANTSA